MWRTFGAITLAAVAERVECYLIVYFAHGVFFGLTMNMVHFVFRFPLHDCVLIPDFCNVIDLKLCQSVFCRPVWFWSCTWCVIVIKMQARVKSPWSTEDLISNTVIRRRFL